MQYSTVELEDLIGKHVLQGVDMERKKIPSPFGDGSEKYASCINFEMDGALYSIQENPRDGYRSMLGTIERIEDPDESIRCKFRLPDIEVIAQINIPYKNILTFYDAHNCKEVLEIGTGWHDDYYPFCVMNYKPENFTINQKGG